MAATDFVELLFIIFGVVMLLMNMRLAAVTFFMVLDAKKWDWITIAAGVFMHVLFGSLLLLALWGVQHF